MEDARAYQELRVGFTAAVSHELRTPLARLLALLETAALPGADRDELLAQAQEQVEQMTELVNDVLFLSEMESGREVVALGGTEVLPVLQEVQARLADSAERADVEILIDAAPDVELPLRRRMLQTVVENLVQNSIRYAGPGSTLTLAARAGVLEVVAELGLFVRRVQRARRRHVPPVTGLRGALQLRAAVQRRADRRAEQGW